MSNVGDIRAVGEPSARNTFPLKLYRALNNPAYSDVIQWCPDGISFLIVDEDRFVQEVMKEMCKTEDFNSFIKQLSMYRFKRENRKPRGTNGENSRKPACRVYHMDGHFRKGDEHLAGTIRSGPGKGSGQSLPVQELRAELRVVKADRDHLSQQLWDLQQAYDSARRELQSLKQHRQVLPEAHQEERRTIPFRMSTSASPSTSRSGAPSNRYESFTTELTANGTLPLDHRPAPAARPTTNEHALVNMELYSSATQPPPQYLAHDTKSFLPVATHSSPGQSRFQDASSFDNQTIAAQRDARNGRPSPVVCVPSNDGMEDEPQQLYISAAPNYTLYTHAGSVVNTIPPPVRNGQAQGNSGWRSAARSFGLPFL